MKIIGFKKNSALKKAGFRVGDDIAAFDGYAVVDELDYIFYDAKNEFSVVALRDGVEITKRIKKDGEVLMGAVLEHKDMEPIKCRNKCLFCFVDQMRNGMRDTLYIKDDDYRLSFLGGNYITLTNLSDFDAERIKRLKLSPLYVSIHAYDSEARRLLLGNRFAGRTWDRLKELGEGGIVFHTQIVLTEGINDGRILEETVTELFKLPYILSVAIVPVGLTKHRDGLADIKPISLECAKKTVEFIECFAKDALKHRGTSFVWCADEFYVKAAIDIPSAEYYEDFCQLENGIGLISRFCAELKEYPVKKTRKNKKIALITGESFYPYLKELAEYITLNSGGIELSVVMIKNDFLGHTVTVAGLLAGGDILSQFTPEADCTTVLIPGAALRAGGVFLDDVTLDDLKSAWGKRVEPSKDDGYEFFELLYKL